MPHSSSGPEDPPASGGAPPASSGRVASPGAAGALAPRGGTAAPTDRPVLSALARFAAELQAGGVPEAVQEHLGLVLLDCLGVILAAASTPAAPVALRVAQLLECPNGSRVPGLGVRSGVLGAALADGLLLMALDFEPVGPEGHVCAVVVPAVLSLLDAFPATGRDVLAALAAGLEVGGRIGSAMRRVGGGSVGRPVRGNSHVIFGAAAAAGRLMRLPPPAMAHALAIAGYCCMPPTLRKAMASPPVGLVKYDSLSVAAQAGVQAALLALAGGTGDLGVLDGPWGFWRYTAHAGYEPAGILEGLGRDWCVPEVWHKRYPGSLFVAPAVEAALHAVRDNALDPGSIQRLVVRLPHPPTAVQAIARPQTWGDAGLSLAVNLAMAVRDVRPRRRWHDLELASSPPVQALTTLVELGSGDLGTPQGSAWQGWAPAEVEVVAGGRRFTARRHWLPRLSRQDIVDKFRDNVSGILATERQEAILEVCLHLADRPTAAQILDATA